MTTMPSRNSEGHQVWNPSVGVYFKPDADQRESFGGVIGALNDQIDSQGGVNKAYPHNFAGIIAAIENLTFTQKEVPVTPDQKPPGGDVSGPDAEGDYEWIWGTQPRDGELWFDTRQGRMFVAIDGEYYQTNGADGLAQVTTDGQMPLNPVVGQFWWDSPSQSLYIFDGFWLDRFGDVKPSYQPGYTPIWRLIVDISESTQTTGTLRLVNADPSSIANATLLPPLGRMDVQNDFNNWVFSALGAIDEVASDKTVVEVGTSAPTNPSSGDLWYDPVGLVLSVWNEDQDSSQWVPTSIDYSYDAEITDLSTKIEAEEFSRNQAITELKGELDVIKQSDINGIRFIEQRIQALQGEINAVPDIDLTGYTTTTALNEAVSSITNEINVVRNSIPAPSSYATSGQFTNLANLINQCLTEGQVQSAIASALPDVTEFVTQTDINNSISNITTQYLPRTGGTLTGSFVVEKANTANPAFDFSTNKWNGRNSYKYLTHSMDGNSHYTTFGTNEKPWEYAWDFSSNEDFCWNHTDNGKIFSIDKTGAAAKDFVIADFAENTQLGTTRLNQVSLKAKIAEYGGDIATAKADINTLKTSLNFSSNKVLYGDIAPTENISDGDLWFDSRNLRLNVQHGGFWVFPDRVEDVQLKSALFNAVNTSTDFETLKIKLLAVLV